MAPVHRIRLQRGKRCHGVPAAELTELAGTARANGTVRVCRERTACPAARAAPKGMIQRLCLGPAAPSQVLASSSYPTLYFCARLASSGPESAPDPTAQSSPRCTLRVVRSRCHAAPSLHPLQHLRPLPSQQQHTACACTRVIMRDVRRILMRILILYCRSSVHKWIRLY